MKGRFGFGSALALAVLAHALAYGAGEGWLYWRRVHGEAIDVDLARSSLLPPTPFRALGAQPSPPKDWYVGDRVRLAPRPAPPPKVPLKPAPEEEASAPPCPAPCPQRAGDWASAASAVRKPEWLAGMISEEDYPEDARFKGVTGLVIVEVLLDETGAVRDVRLLRGADPSLDAETLKKLRESRFSPCVDASGHPFPCALELPINWTLE